MARLYPFRALRYDTAKINLEDVVTQPYDMISPKMQQAYCDRSPTTSSASSSASTT